MKTRTYRCINCGAEKTGVFKSRWTGEQARYIQCPNCEDYEMKWVE